MKILNLTQHQATPEQVKFGVVEPKPEVKACIRELLTFSDIPSQIEMSGRAFELARISRNSGCDAAMIGGAPFFMAPLEKYLGTVGVTPVYAFSIRESVEKVIDGKTVKTAVFRHLGFVGIENVFSGACQGRVGWHDGQHPQCCGNCVA